MGRKTFTTSDTFSEWVREGHNGRTRNAWEHGVKVAVTGCELIYQGTGRDYALAELCGRNHASLLLRAGRSWLCGECRTEHGIPTSSVTALAKGLLDA